jgi:hypothetical protein
MASVPTVKKVSLTNEDTYRREKMIEWLKARGMLNAGAERFVRQSS